MALVSTKKILMTYFFFVLRYIWCEFPKKNLQQIPTKNYLMALSQHFQLALCRDPNTDTYYLLAGGQKVLMSFPLEMLYTFITIYQSPYPKQNLGNFEITYGDVSDILFYPVGSTEFNFNKTSSPGKLQTKVNIGHPKNNCFFFHYFCAITTTCIPQKIFPIIPERTICYFPNFWHSVKYKLKLEFALIIMIKKTTIKFYITSSN